MKLSKREWQIYNAIASEGRDWSVEDLGAFLWSEKPRPKSWEARVLEIMTLLCAKTQALGLNPPIERLSPLGRGNKAEYGVKRDAR